MEKKHIISIAGDLASGKGTVSKIIGEKLNYTIYKNGEYFRKLAKESKMDVTTFNEYSAHEYSLTHDNFIIDARLGWYAVPESFKVYLTVDIGVAAKRAFEDQDRIRKETEHFDTVEEQKNDMIKRTKLENERYFKLYNVHKDDLNNYNLIIDTTHKTPEEVAKIIIEKYNNWLNEI